MKDPTMTKFAFRLQQALFFYGLYIIDIQLIREYTSLALTYMYKDIKKNLILKRQLNKA